MDGLNSPSELAQAAKDAGQTALAITDHGTLSSHREMQLACKEVGIKPILGVEAYISPTDRFDRSSKTDKSIQAYNHIILLAKNRTGLKNINSLQELAWNEGFYHKPRIDREILKEYSEGIIVLSGCLNGLISKAIEKGEFEEAKIVLQDFKKTFGKDFYIEVQSHNPKKIKVFYWPWSLRYKSQELKRIHDGDDYKFWDSIDQPNTIVTKTDIDNTKIRDTKFLLMNRRLRPQRMILLCMLGIDFIKNNLVSYDIKLFDRENDLDFYSHHAGDDVATELYNNSIDIIKNKIQTIDYDDINSVWGFNFENKKPYLDSYISIVTETNFYEEGLYLSEKTWKPIGHLQPFIQVNKSGALKELHSLGFKTFSPFINEEYDNETDDNKRIKMISSEIHRLNNLSTSEIHLWYHSILDILIHNQEVLFKYAENKQEIEREFITKLKNICG